MSSQYRTIKAATSHTKSKATQSNRSPTTNVLTPSTVSELFNRGKVLGEGQYGIAKLVTMNGIKYVAKLFTGPSARRDKYYEESNHIIIWNRMSKGCKQHLCQPLKSPHPTISLQHAASQTGDVLTYDKFLSLRLILSPTLRTAFNNKDALAAAQFVDALQCLHMSGAAHGNVKLDNALVAYKKNKLNQISEMKVKLIDFGGSVTTKRRPLVMLRNNGSLNASPLKQAVRKKWGNTSASPIEGGLFTNAAYVKPSRRMPSREHYIEHQILPRLGGTNRFRAEYKSGIQKKHTQARKLLSRVAQQVRSKYYDKTFSSLSPILPEVTKWMQNRH